MNPLTFYKKWKQKRSINKITKELRKYCKNTRECMPEEVFSEMNYYKVIDELEGEINYNLNQLNLVDSKQSIDILEKAFKEAGFEILRPATDRGYFRALMDTINFDVGFAEGKWITPHGDIDPDDYSCNDCNHKLCQWHNYRELNN